MAIDQGTATLAVTTQERTWRVNIETQRLTDPVITAYRQVVRTAADSSIVSIENAPTTQRSASAIAAETQTFTPATVGVVTGAELASLIAARADMWREQDIAAHATPIA